jgi:hypothetical protein
LTDAATLARLAETRCGWFNTVNEAGAEKVMMFPPPVRTKSSMVSAWAVRGRVKAEARRAKVKRALRIE